LCDIAFTTLAFVVLLPVLLIVAALVRVKLGAPVLFRQLRPGLHGRPFTIYKFRTMTDARDHDGRLLPDTDRLTTLSVLGLLSVSPGLLILGGFHTCGTHAVHIWYTCGTHAVKHAVRTEARSAYRGFSQRLDDEFGCA
jgi:hypothetical protein